MSEGGSSGGLLGTLVSVLGDLFGGGTNNGLPQWVTNQLDILGLGEQQFMDTLDSAWGALSTLLKDAIQDVIIAGITGLIRIISEILQWIQNFLKPLLTWIARIMKWFHQYIEPILKDIIEVIQRVRVILTLLQLLGVKWAAKLNADLQQIQNWVTLAINDIVKTLNTISSIISLVVDPAQIIRRDFFSNTLFSNLSGVKQAAGYGTDRTSTPGEITQQQQYDNAVKSGGPLVTFDSVGNATDDPAVSATQSQINAAMTGEGLPTYAS